MLESPCYPEMAFNNTYNFPVINKNAYHDLLKSSMGPGGVQDRIRQCRDVAAQKDPDFNSNDAGVNAQCAAALLGPMGQIAVLGTNFANSDVRPYYSPPSPLILPAKRL